ncbi:MAG: LPD1 domain-containing protein, partial [Coprobacillaceae bacterium]
MNIEDFGEKIGGAKKDNWKKRGLTSNDTEDMNERERSKYIVKNNIWIKPNYQEMVDNGMSKRVVYFMKMVRDSLPTKPSYNTHDRNIQDNYINTVLELRDIVMGLKDDHELLFFFKNRIEGIFVFNNPSSPFLEVKETAIRTINNKVLHALRETYFPTIDKEIVKKQFCYTTEEKILAPYKIDKFDSSHSFSEENNDTISLERKTASGKYYMYPKDELINPNNWIVNTFYISRSSSIIANNFNTIEEAQNYILEKDGKEKNEQSTRQGKKRFIPKQLEGIERTGDDYRKNTAITGDDYLKVFQFKGGEFGNWLNETDRQESLNFAFDALIDLAKALDIDDKSLSLNKSLSIAFGARGHGSALAHYEPLRNVINLTKMNGAGSLAHEWAHALDDYLGNQFGCRGLLTANYSKIEELKELKNLIDCMKYSEGKPTEYYLNSMRLDSDFSKTDGRYWQSNEEMFARAFACYVYDKLGFESDYLCGHANLVVTADGVLGFPLGREREEINKC